MVNLCSTTCTVATMPIAKTPATTALIKANTITIRLARLCLRSIRLLDSSADVGDCKPLRHDVIQSRSFASTGAVVKWP